LISVTDGSRRLLGTIPAVEEGHFQANVIVPADVPLGDYLLEAGVQNVAIRAPLSIAGTPIVGEGGAGGPDQADALIQPAPSAGSAGPAKPAIPAGRTSADSDWGPLGAIGAVMIAAFGAIGLLAALRVRARRSFLSSQRRS
jgi:hypothetical protein